MSLFPFVDVYRSVFDDEGEPTEKGTSLNSKGWFELAHQTAPYMRANQWYIDAFHKICERIDWQNVDLHDASTIFFELASIDEIGKFSVYADKNADLLDKVMDCTVHRSTSEEVAVVLSNHPHWTPKGGLIRDFLAHLVYNRIEEGHDYQKTLALFVARWDADTFIQVFEENAWDFLHEEDLNWETSFVSSDIDQWSAQWPMKQQKQFYDIVQSRDYFPNLSARVQRSVLENEIQQSATQNTTRRRI